MYKNFIFKKIGTGILILFVSAGILVGLIFLNMESLKQIDETRQMMMAFFFGGLYILVWWYVFWRFFINLKIMQNAGAEKKSLQETKTSLMNYFSQAKSNDGQYFEVTEIKDGLQVSWNKTIDFKQLISYGSNSVNYKVSFIFNEKKHDCGIYTSIVRISKNVGILGLFYSIRWNGGVIYEAGENYVPSFSLNNGSVSMDIKKLSYNNATIIDPAIEILKMSGWTSVFLMLKHKFSRIIYYFFGWILLLVSIVLILFGSLGFYNINSNVVLLDDNIFLSTNKTTSKDSTNLLNFVVGIYSDKKYSNGREAVCTKNFLKSESKDSFLDKKNCPNTSNNFDFFSTSHTKTGFEEYVLINDFINNPEPIKKYLALEKNSTTNKNYMDVYSRFILSQTVDDISSRLSTLSNEEYLNKLSDLFNFDFMSMSSSTDLFLITDLANSGAYNYYLTSKVNDEKNLADNRDLVNSEFRNEFEESTFNVYGFKPFGLFPCNIINTYAFYSDRLILTRKKQAKDCQKYDIQELNDIPENFDSTLVEIYKISPSVLEKAKQIKI